METQNNLEKIKNFFSQKGINKSGICSEAGITVIYLNRVLTGKQPLNEKLLKKLFPVLGKYGFK